jgi:hypothetical protein
LQLIDQSISFSFFQILLLRVSFVVLLVVVVLVVPAAAVAAGIRYAVIEVAIRDSEHMPMSQFRINGQRNGSRLFALLFQDSS